jgi:hypothetical protein
MFQTTLPRQDSRDLLRQARDARGDGGGAKARYSWPFSVAANYRAMLFVAHGDKGAPAGSAGPSTFVT